MFLHEIWSKPTELPSTLQDTLRAARARAESVDATPTPARSQVPRVEGCYGGESLMIMAV